MWKSRWPSWAFRPNEPDGFCGRKATLNRASALVTVCPWYVNRHPRTWSSTNHCKWDRLFTLCETRLSRGGKKKKKKKKKHVSFFSCYSMSDCSYVYSVHILVCIKNKIKKVCRPCDSTWGENLWYRAWVNVVASKLWTLNCLRISANRCWPFWRNAVSYTQLTLPTSGRV